MTDKDAKFAQEDTPRTSTDIESRSGNTPTSPSSDDEEDTPRTSTDIESRSGEQTDKQADTEEIDPPRG